MKLAAGSNCCLEMGKSDRVSPILGANDRLGDSKPRTNDIEYIQLTSELQLRRLHTQYLSVYIYL